MGPDRLFQLLLTGQSRSYWSWWEKTLATGISNVALGVSQPSMEKTRARTSNLNTKPVPEATQAENPYEQFINSKQGRIRLIRCPPAVARSTWTVTFRHVLERHRAISFALLRHPSEGSTMPYVYTNPEATTLVGTLDRIYVIDNPDFSLNDIMPQHDETDNKPVRLVKPHSSGAGLTAEQVVHAERHSVARTHRI